MVRSFVSAAALIAVGMSASANAAVFNTANLAVIQAGDGSAALANNSVYSLLEITKVAGQVSPVQTIAISGQTTNPMWTSATATSTSYLSRSQSGDIVFSGHTSRGTSPFPNANTITGRAVATVDVNGNYAQNIAYTGSSGQQTRSGLVFSSGTTFAVDQAGLYASSAVAANLGGNFRNGRIFGGTGFVLQQSSTAANIVVSQVGGTSLAPTIAGLAGLTNISSAQDFYMLDSAGTGTFDLLYITTNTSATAGSILKFQNVSGTWTPRGSAVTTGLFALAAEVLPTGGIALYATSGNGATSANTVLGFNDTAGAGFNIALGGATTLYTTGVNTTLKGIELAPIPAPGSLALLGLGGLVAIRRRRN